MSEPERLIDLSHVIRDGMVTYPGLPAPMICDFLSREDSRARYAPGTEFHIARIEMVANTGTYVDAPSHRFEDGMDLSELPLSSLANLEGLVVPVPEGQRTIGLDLFRSLDVRGKAVLVRTGWSRHWGTPRYFTGHPFLSAKAASWLAAKGAVLVGIDSLNIDDMDDLARPVHTTLLGKGIPVAEHLTNLSALPTSGFRFFAAPVKLRAVGTFPVRALAVLDA